MTTFNSDLLAFERRAPATEDDDRQAMIDNANALLDSIDEYIGGTESPKDWKLGLPLMSYKDEVRDFIAYVTDRLDPQPSLCRCAEKFHRKRDGCTTWGDGE